MFNLKVPRESFLIYGVKWGALSTLSYIFIVVIFGYLMGLGPEGRYQMFGPYNILFNLLTIIVFLTVFPILCYRIGLKNPTNHPYKSGFLFSLGYIYTPLLIAYLFYFLQGSPYHFLYAFTFEGFGGLILILAPFIALFFSLFSLLFAFLGKLDGLRNSSTFLYLSIIIIVASDVLYAMAYSFQ